MFGSDVDNTKIRNISKAPIKPTEESGVVLGSLVPAEFTVETLVDCLKQHSFCSAVLAAVADCNYRWLLVGSGVGSATC
jgi:hypothetical protein